MDIRLARLRRRARVLSIAGALLFTWAGTASAQLKVGIVDLGRAMEQSKGGKEALSSLKKIGDNFRQQLLAKTETLRRMEQELLKQQQDLRQKSLLFSEEVRRQKEDDLLRRQREFERSRDELVRLRREAEADFERERRRVNRKIRRELRDVIVRIGKEDKFTLILERSVVLFFDGERVDLTDEVVKAYDKVRR
ncbi:MAG: OmpH family outer membrane protein [Nitrospinota bacterium]